MKISKIEESDDNSLRELMLSEIVLGNNVQSFEFEFVALC